MNGLGDLYLLAMLKQSAPRKKAKTTGNGGVAAAAAGGAAVGAAAAGGGTSYLMARIMRKAMDARAAGLKADLEGKLKAFQAMKPLQKIRFLLKGKK